MRIALPRSSMLVLCAGLGACATSDDLMMESRYEASLAHWKGVPESQLLATWGRPQASADLPEGRLLVFVSRHDIENASAPQMYHTVTAFGAPMMAAGMTSAPRVPATCTTRFVVQGGVVAGWKFDGIGCGAPD